MLPEDQPADLRGQGRGLDEHADLARARSHSCLVPVCPETTATPRITRGARRDSACASTAGSLASAAATSASAASSSASAAGRVADRGLDARSPITAFLPLPNYTARVLPRRFSHA